VPHTDSAPRIYYEVQGAAGDPPLVLLEGMGAQMIGWRQGFVDLLAAQDLRVIRMDNRDVGLSDKLGKWHQHDARYSLRDMADDVCRVLDALGLESAHIVGQSMGGIIAQTMAIHRPDRVRSLGLIYTAPAFDAAFVQPDFLKKLGQGLPRLPFRIPRWALMRMFAAEMESSASAPFPLDMAWQHELLIRSYDRGFRLDGIDYRPLLGTITAPTTVIQGDRDHAIKKEAAFVLAAGIPDAGLHLFPGMGHAVAEALWPELVTIIARNARRAPD
jgi:pimeloyl-ACP methyl ester carboxylesterase